MSMWYSPGSQVSTFSKSGKRVPLVVLMEHPKNSDKIICHRLKDTSKTYTMRKDKVQGHQRHYETPVEVADCMESMITELLLTCPTPVIDDDPVPEVVVEPLIKKTKKTKKEKSPPKSNTEKIAERKADMETREKQINPGMCMCRIWNPSRLPNIQCTKAINQYSDRYCTRHMNIIGERDEGWWLGDIDKPPPKSPMLYKGKNHYWKDDKPQRKKKSK